MAQTNEQRIQSAIDSTRDGVMDEVAVFLKENYGMIRAGFPERNLPERPSDEAFKDMAKSAVLHRELIIPGATVGQNQVITFREFDAKIKSQPGGADALKAFGADSVEALVPKRSQVEKIAQAVGEGVAENLGGGAGGASVYNMGVGAVAWATSLGEKGASEKAVAEQFSQSTTKKLTGLLQSDPSLKPFLTQGENGTIARIGDAVEERVLNPDGPTDRKRLEKAAIKPLSEALKNNIGNGIYKETEEATYKGIAAEVDKRVEEAGFFGTIAKMLGPGITNFFITVANFFINMVSGTPISYIPTEPEVYNASQVVGGAVRDVFAGNEKAPANAEQAKDMVREKVRTDLEKYKDQYPAFNSEQLDQMAVRAGEAAEKKFGLIPKFTPGSDNQAAPDTGLAKAMEAAGRSNNLPVQDMGDGGPENLTPSTTQAKGGPSAGKKQPAAASSGASF